MKWLVYLLMRWFPMLSADYRQRRIKPRQMCPACGAMAKHEMKWDARQQKVVLICRSCEAAWGYNPVVNASRWAKAGEES